MTEEMKKNRLIALNNAIINWTDKLNGIYGGSWGSKRYTKEFCKEQIEYFENEKKILLNEK